MRRVYKILCPATISASIMATNKRKNSMKNVESDNNKILYETLLDLFLQRNGTYFLNRPRICTRGNSIKRPSYVVVCHKTTNSCNNFLIRSKNFVA